MIDVIQIGANIGNTPQVIIWPVVRDNGWNCIFVEPHPEAFEQLVKNYSDLVGSHFENIAICAHDGTVKFHYGKDSQIASLNRDHSINAFGGVRNNNEIEVPCSTLSSLIKKYDMKGKPFELLQIDAEGADGSILICTDFTEILPKYIRFEHIYLNRHLTLSRPDAIRKGLLEILEHLCRFGYRLVKDQYNSGQESEDNIDTMMERKNGLS